MSITRRTFKGRKQYRYHVWDKDQGRLVSSKWFNSKAEAAKEELKQKSMMAEQTSGLTFYRVAMEYIEASLETNTAKTISLKRTILDKYYAPIMFEPIDKITPVMIRDMLKNDDYFQARATETKKRVKNFGHAVFKYAQTFYNLPSNPMDAIPAFQATDEERLREMQIYTPLQFQKFLDAIPDQYEEYRALFFVLYWTGMRLNEANSLTFKDVSPKRIRLYRQRVNGKWAKLKTVNSARNIPIDPKTYAVFESMRKKWAGYGGFTPDWFCFGGLRPLAYTSIERVKNMAYRKAGLPYIRIHDFRHSHASNLIEAGVNIYKISKRLGHSSISVTLDRYGHLIDDDGDEIISAIKSF